MNTDRETAPARGEGPGTLGRSSLVSVESPSRASSQATAQDSIPVPQNPPDNAKNEAIRPRLPRKAPASADPGPPLRYRRTPFWLAALYLITLVVPWILMCILNKRPFTTPSYYYQKGGVPPREYIALTGVVAFVNVLRSISGVIVVPITSIILAHAAVVYSQRRRHEQELNMRQLFALADRGWANLATLWNCRREGSSSRLLWLGALLLLLGGIQQPLQSLLVSFQPIMGMSCLDLPTGPCSSESTAMTVGIDVEPWAMAVTSHVIVTEDVANSLVSVSDTVPQDYLWVDDPHTVEEYTSVFEKPPLRSMLHYYGSDSDEKKHPGARFFVSSLANGTETGVLREHALRLNSSVTCEKIERSEYPSPCPGKRPLVTELDRSDISLRICAPGEIGVHPWTKTRNREDIEEEVYFDFEMSEEFRQTMLVNNFTMHCTAGTSRGYFELGNAMNDNVYGPLLEKWPSAKEIENDSADFLSDWTRPEETDHSDEVDPDDEFLPGYQAMGDPFGVWYIPVSGPLMTSATALFGNNSFLHLVSDNATGMTPGQTLAVLCEHGGIPFTQLLGVDHLGNEGHLSNCRQIPTRVPFDEFEEHADASIDAVIASWFGMFQETYGAEYLLEIAMYLSNRATLNTAVSGTNLIYGREIFRSPGTMFIKPTMHLASVIVISIFVLLQVVGLAILVWYVNTVPTWAPSLDAMAIARIGRAMRGGELPPIGPVSDRDREKLRGVDALVGTVDGGGRQGPPLREPAESGDQTGPDRPLIDSCVAGVARDLGFGLGAKGLITRDAVPEKPSWFGMRRRTKGRDEKV